MAISGTFLSRWFLCCCCCCCFFLFFGLFVFLPENGESFLGYILKTSGHTCVHYCKFEWPFLKYTLGKEGCLIAPLPRASPWTHVNASAHSYFCPTNVENLPRPMKCIIVIRSRVLPSTKVGINYGILLLSTEFVLGFQVKYNGGPPT